MVKNINFGEHMIYDAYGCAFESLSSRDLCSDVLQNLASLSEMTKLSDPIVLSSEGNETLGGKDPGGFTGIIFIQESHISIHTFAKRGFVTIDLYSCKEFNSEGIVSYLDSVFKPRDKDLLFFKRGMKYPRDNIYE